MSTEIIPPAESKPATMSATYMTARPQGDARFAETDFSFAELSRIVRKRKGIIWKITAVCFTLALVYTLVVTPRFRSQANIEFNKENTDSLALDEQRAMLGDAGAIDYSVTQQTQVKTLLSDTLALRVIEELNLETRPEFARKQLLSDFLFTPVNESALPLEHAPHRRVRILKVFHKNLTVAAVPGTRLINIQFLNPDPQMAALIVNTLVRDYKDQHFQNRYSATLEASGWLSKQLDDLKNQVETSQQKLVDYQKQAGILGTDETHNIVMTRLEEVDKELSQAEANRIVAHTVLQLVRTGSPELVSGLINDTITSAYSMSPVALNHLQGLRFQQSDLKLQYAEAASQYGSANPKLIELKSKMDEIDETIQQEIKKLYTRAENDYAAAQQNEQSLREDFEAKKQEANRLNDSAVQYTILKHEVESNRTLYDGLVKKFKEAGVLAGLRNSNILVLDEALPADRPARPIVPLNLGLGLFLGLMFGMSAAFVAENVDDTITTGVDAEEIAALQALATIPSWNFSSKRLAARREKALPGAVRDTGICVIDHPRSQPAEAFRALRTSIMQSTRKGKCTSIVFTSALPGEGKSTVSLNCAAALARQGSRVLLVEADMRRPGMNSKLNLNQTSGLSSLLKGELTPGLPVSLPSLSQLSVMPAGPRTSYAAELLGSDRMKELVKGWSEQYDYILFDTPPALTVTDAVVLAPHCDVVTLVARSKVTKRQSLIRLCALFSRVQRRVLGVVVNGFDLDSPDFAAYYGYENDKHSGDYYTSLPN